MKFYIKHADKIAGLFVLLAIALLSAVLIFMGVNQRWFKKDYHFTARFTSAEGLTSGMPIKMKGFEIGKVSRITMDNQNIVIIDFHIYDTYYDRITPYSVLQLSTSPIGLGSSLVLHPGRVTAEPVPEGYEIPTSDSIQGKDMIARGLVDIPKGEDTINTLLGKVGPILDSVHSAVDSITLTVDSAHGALAGSEDFPEEGILVGLKDTIGEIKSLSENLRSQIIPILDKTYLSLANLEELSAQLKDTEGLVTRLIAPEGSIATLLSDDNELYGRIDSLLIKLDGIVENIKNFSDYVSDASPQVTALLDETRTTLEQGKDLLQGVSNNPLIRGGIPEKKDPNLIQSGLRDGGF